MPNQPSRSMIHVDVPLRNLSIAYQQSQDEFIADKVFPKVPVQRQSDRYYVYRKGDWFRTAAAKRAPATESVGTGYTLDNSPSYFCDRWAIHHDIPDEDYANADEVIDVEDDAQQLCSRHILLRREVVWFKQYMRTNTWSGLSSGDFTGTTGAGYWNSSNSNPALDIDNIKRAVHGGTGFKLNTMVITSDLFYALKNHPTILDKYKYTQAGIITEQLLAAAFDIPRLFVADAILNTAQEGQADNLNYIMSNAFLLCYSAPAPGLKRPSAGYTFSWTGMPGSGGSDTVVQKWYKQELKATRVEAEVAFSMQATGLDLGVLGTGMLQ